MDFLIYMNPKTKQLLIRNRINLYHHESLVDKIKFIIPIEYSDALPDLRMTNISMVYLDPTETAHVELLTIDEYDYKEEGEYFTATLPVSSELNRYIGDNEVHLEFTLMDYAAKLRYKLKTESVIIPILQLKDYFQVIPDESFNAIDDRIAILQALTDELAAGAEIYDKKKADNHMINEDGQLVLTANGEPIGDALDVATVEVPDSDEDVDGIIDISGKYTDVEV